MLLNDGVLKQKSEFKTEKHNSAIATSNVRKEEFLRKHQKERETKRTNNTN